jgi:predicted nucleotidyltransferase
MPHEANARPLPDPAMLEDFCHRWRIIELSLVEEQASEKEEPEGLTAIVRYAPDADWSLLDISRASRELQAILGREVYVTSRTAVETDQNWIRRSWQIEQARTIYPL